MIASFSIIIARIFMDCRWGCSRMLLKIKTAGAAAAIMLLAGCGMVDGRGDGRLPAPMAVRDYPVKIGRAYQIGGVTYTPADAPEYDEVGYASWFGGAHKGKPTANEEHFRPEGISAAQIGRAHV